jgi:hypothetical protein
LVLRVQPKWDEKWLVIDVVAVAPVREDRQRQQRDRDEEPDESG